jgi:hypothetical protein
MMCESKEQYGFIRLDDPSYHEILETAKTKSIKEILCAEAVTPSQRLSITIHSLATVVTSEDLKFSFWTCLSL